MTSEELATICTTAAADKKAVDIVALDLRGISTITDFFVICSGTSEPHLRALASSIEETLRKDHGVRVHAMDGSPASQWVLLDYGDVIIHLFHETKRQFYSLEDLWSDAPRLKIEGLEEPPRP